MARWEPDARSRLENAALDLFHRHGFDTVTVPQIAVHAGLTTRTFFRHFKDKREVLFADADQIPALAARIVREAPPELAPMDVVRQGLPRLVSEAFDEPYEQIVRRAAVVASHEGLRERELGKMEAVATSIAGAFRDRGMDPIAAEVVAETAVGLVKVAIKQWSAAHGELALASAMLDAFESLQSAFALIEP